MHYSLWKRVKVKLLGRAYLEHRTCPGWKDYLPFYLAYCPKHGYYESYPHGHDGYLICPSCLKEEVKHA